MIVIGLVVAMSMHGPIDIFGQAAMRVAVRFDHLEMVVDSFEHDGGMSSHRRNRPESQGYAQKERARRRYDVPQALHTPNRCSVFIAAVHMTHLFYPPRGDTHRLWQIHIFTQIIPP